MANPGKGAMERQLRRQSTWLRECLRWIMREKVLSGAGRPKALDVGCGPGFVTESLADLIDVSSVDTDEDMVNFCRALGLPGDSLRKKVQHTNSRLRMKPST